MNNNIISVTYAQNGSSTALNEMGMRDMQARAYEQKHKQYLLLKSPPASGKSRALMFLALYKLHNQGIRKVIAAVPEMAIGGSFAPTKLSEHGFFTDWEPNPYYNLCTPGENSSKVARFQEFMEDEKASILICTHATLRFAYDTLPRSAFNDCLLGLDEFHHVSADKESSRLGELLHGIMRETNAHVVAMTGSYFRGDNVPILLPEDEAKYTRVVYTYYDQLNGYTYLKTLGIGYHFYQGSYLDALPEVLDTNKKTILHIPHVNSAASTGDKEREVGRILDIIGEIEYQDQETKLMHVRRKGDGKIIKVADLVNDDPQHRAPLVNYLRTVKEPEDLDIIIALGMAKEGFDWPACEHALTIGYRGSLTEVIQIIGRATRDYPGKEHTQFTNLLAAPSASDDEVTLSVNNMLKAISASLLMEQVLAPSFAFLARTAANEKKPGTLLIKGLEENMTQRVRDIVENDMVDLKARIMQDDTVCKFISNPKADPQIVNKVLIPKIIEDRYENLTKQEVESLRQMVVVSNALKKENVKTETDKNGVTRQFIRMADSFVNIDELDINLIDRINPFCGAYEILGKQLDAPVFRAIRDSIISTRIKLTLADAIKLWNAIKEFYKEFGKHPNPVSNDPHEATLGEALILLKNAGNKQGL